MSRHQTSNHIDTTPRRAPAVREAITRLREGGDEQERGVVYTRAEVVCAMLDLAGWRADAPLHQMRLLEPSCGEGVFLVEAVRRLLAAYERAGGSAARALSELAGCVVGVELHAASSAACGAHLQEVCERWGMRAAAAEALVASWLVCDDFLMTALDGEFDAVVGTPPYVRQERLPAALLEQYRTRYATMYDRADLYVPFFERGLGVLGEGGRLCFVCANRWLKNKYGGPLRQLVAERFHLEHYIDLVGVDAFTADVLAYPAITTFSRAASKDDAKKFATRVSVRPAVEALPKVVEAMRADTTPSDRAGVVEVHGVARARDPWLVDDPETLSLIRRIEDAHPTLEEAGCEVKIGVATGCDRVFIAPLDALPVEDARKLPLAMAADVDGGRVEWGGLGLLNPFEPDGTLAALEDYPRFAAYLAQHEEALRARYIARKQPARWYATIDRVWASLTHQEKLLIPDIKGQPTIGYDPGTLYPHHNLYVILSDTWHLRALQAVLASSLTTLFVRAYAVHMAGGFLRFQAQYLRRLRLPRWEYVPEHLRDELVTAGTAYDHARMDAAVAKLYGLNPHELALCQDRASGGSR